jgi:hypothetical protein
VLFKAFCAMSGGSLSKLEIVQIKVKRSEQA